MTQEQLPLRIDEDPELAAVAEWMLAQPRASERIGDAIRRAIDEVLDGPRTGRFLYEELANSEKTYTGTKVEILLREEFRLPRGPAPKRLDFDIGGVAVDCKFSQSTSWMIPVEAVDEICMLVTASEAAAQYSLGVLRCRKEFLNAPNRDLKRSINVTGRAQAVWVFRKARMPENLLRELSENDRIAIMSTPASGQLRMNELFRRVQARIVRREVTLTVARQDDGMKRVRDARRHLQPEGILVLGHQGDHPRIAAELDLPVPKKGEFVSVRVVLAQAGVQRRTKIGEGIWRRATADDALQAGPLSY